MEILLIIGIIVVISCVAVGLLALILVPWHLPSKQKVFLITYQDGILDQVFIKASCAEHAIDKFHKKYGWTPLITGIEVYHD